MLPRLDCVERVIAAQRDGDEPAVAPAHDDQLQRRFERDLQQRGNVFAGLLRRRRHLLQRLLCRRARTRRTRLGDFEVRRVIAGSGPVAIWID